jgi:hypothetical protein
MEVDDVYKYNISIWTKCSNYVKKTKNQLLGDLPVLYTYSSREREDNYGTYHFRYQVLVLVVLVLEVAVLGISMAVLVRTCRALQNIYTSKNTRVPEYFEVHVGVLVLTV